MQGIIDRYISKFTLSSMRTKPYLASPRPINRLQPLRSAVCGVGKNQSLLLCLVSVLGRAARRGAADSEDGKFAVPKYSKKTPPSGYPGTARGSSGKSPGDWPGDPDHLGTLRGKTYFITREENRRAYLLPGRGLDCGENPSPGVWPHFQPALDGHPVHCQPTREVACHPSVTRAFE